MPLSPLHCEFKKKIVTTTTGISLRVQAKFVNIDHNLLSRHESATCSLKSAVACDQAIAIATKRKNDLLFQQTVSEKTKTDQVSIVNQNNARLVSLLAEITGAEAGIAALPAGKDKEAYTSKLHRLNDRKEHLVDRLKRSGSASLLETELDTALINIQLTEIDSFISAINTRKATL